MVPLANREKTIMSHRHIRTMLVLTLPFLISACSISDVAQLKSREITKTDYRSHLAEKYRHLSVFESEQMMDHIDAGLFARKGLAALDTPTPPVPENPGQWSIDDVYLPAIMAAQKQLLTALSLTLHNRHPEAMAEAVTAFDCWLEQAEEGWQTDHIAACQQRFEEAVQALADESGYRFDRAGRAHRQVTLHYPVDQAALAIADTIKLDTLLSELPAGQTYTAHIIGHADRLGSEAHNNGLTRRRALTVHRRLIELGAAPRTLGVAWRGENAPLVHTADNMPDARNRRTEIIWTVYPQQPPAAQATR